MMVDILVNLPIKACDTPYTYIVPDNLKDKVEVGSCVLIPFGKQTQLGFILKFIEDKPNFELKEIIDIIDEPPLFNEEQLKIAYFLQKNYFCSLTQALHCILPIGKRFKLIRTIKLKNIPPDGLKKEYEKVVNFLKENKEEIELNKLKKINSKNIYNIINNLNKKNIIEVKTKLKAQAVKPKIIKTVTIKNHSLYGEIDNRYQKIIKFVQQNNGLFTKTQVANFTKTTLSVINKLINDNILAINPLEVIREPHFEYYYSEDVEINLTDEQKNVINKIKQKIDENNHEVILLHGITGSGKTQIYIELTKYVLSKNKQIIILLPEIAISSQIELIFKREFNNEVAILHSKLSTGERYDAYRRIKNNTARVIIGARSAIFAPVNKLGLIIIDEEQDPSYKQDTDPRYNAKDVAIELGRYFSCPIVLGSATPALESYHKYNKLFLTKRIYDTPLPKVEIVDMRKEFRRGNKGLISNRLRFAIRKALYNDEQVILFLNRRGMSHFVFCKDCGYVFHCPNCEVTLTYHQENNELLCHYCGFNKELSSICPTCSGYNLDSRSYGTEKLEQDIKRIFKKARVLRMDKDTTQKKGSYYHIINTFRNREADILIGTQMLTKGFHFPQVSLVGIINADVTLNIPDFRSAERTYQLLTQVAGRSGRYKTQGYVIIQTYRPNHFVIRAASYQDYKRFYNYEINYRKRLSYPPFANLIDIIVSDSDKNKARESIYSLYNIIKPVRESAECIDILGPSECILSKLKNKYRYHILIKYKGEINSKLQHYLTKFYELNKEVKPIINVDPQEII